MKLAFEIAGTRYHSAAFEAAKVTKGDTIELKAEPANPHDPNAIKVLKDGHHIGYVPRMFTENVHPLLKNSQGTATVEAAWDSGCSVIFENTCL